MGRTRQKGNAIGILGQMDVDQHMNSIKKIHPELYQTLRKRGLSSSAREVKELLQNGEKRHNPKATAHLLNKEIVTRVLQPEELSTLLLHFKERKSDLPTHEAMKQFLEENY